MKQKKMTYVLIASVAAVWGIIFYKMFLAASPDDLQSYQSAGVKYAEAPLDDYMVKDTFTLAFNYRDPFTGKLEITEEMPSGPVKPVDIARPVLPIAPTINWSLIRYSGYITNPVTKKIVSIMNINNKERIMAENETLDGFRLIKNCKDSVKVGYQGKTKFILLK